MPDSFPAADMTDISEAARVASLLAESASCIDCIVRKAAVSRERADELVREIGSTVNLIRKTGRCDLCASVRPVHRIEK
jgi:hypothetical protein